jgi:hypothetical protein
MTSQLPKETEDAIAVLRLATEFVTGYLAGPEPHKGGRARCRQDRRQRMRLIRLYAFGQVGLLFGRPVM